MIELRPYQASTVFDTARLLRAGRRPLVVMPTGAGKTVVAAAIIRNLSLPRLGMGVLFLAHRVELLQQAKDELPLGCTLMTVQAYAHKDALPDISLVIIDEAHHASAASYVSAIEKHPAAMLCGLTATPYRLDAKPLKHFTDIVEHSTVAELAADGYIIIPGVYAGRLIPDVSKVKTQGGDFSKKQLSIVCNTQPLICDVFTSWHQHAFGKATIIYATSVTHAIALRDQFRACHVQADAVHGRMPREERSRVVTSFRHGFTKVLVNYGILTEGFDVPNASCCILARPTKSLSLYKQMVGRVMRRNYMKSSALVLDHAGNVDRHGLPDDPVEHSLEVAAKAPKDGPAPARLATCKDCYAIFRYSTKCPQCGATAIPSIPAPVRVSAGEMRKVERVSYEKLLNLASLSGYRVGWARREYKRLSGRWPAFFALERKHYRPAGFELTEAELAIRGYVGPNMWAKIADWALDYRRGRK